MGLGISHHSTLKLSLDNLETVTTIEMMGKILEQISVEVSYKDAVESKSYANGVIVIKYFNKEIVRAVKNHETKLWHIDSLDELKHIVSSQQSIKA